MKRNFLGRRLGVKLSLVVALCSVPLGVSAQQTPGIAREVSTGTVVPKLVNYSGTLADLNGKPISEITGVTFALYKESQGGAPLWMETQSVRPASSGHYAVMLGSTTSRGLPDEVFVSGEARWLGVQIAGQAEQPRVLLVAVPYALKAHDAETIGGLPPSAFMLAAPANSAVQANTANAPTGLTPTTAVTGTGTTGQIPLWDSASDIVNSVMTQTGSGGTARIGINTTTPTATLEVKGAGTFRGSLGLPSTGPATAATGKNSYNLLMTATAFNSGTGTSVNQNFRFQAEPVGNNTSSTSGTLNLLYSSGTNAGAETGFKIASNGQVTFAAGQTFPGVGSLTSVGSGSGLTGGPITSTGSLSIATGGVTNAMLQNSTLTISPTSPLSGGGTVGLGGTTVLGLINCTSSGQILKWDRNWGCAADNNSGGTVTSVAAGSGLLGGPITTTGTLTVDPSVVAELARPNSFISYQTISAPGGKFVPLTVNNTAGGVGVLLNGGTDGLVANGQSFPIAVSTSGAEAIYAENDGTTRGDSGVLGATFGSSGVLYGLFGWNSNSPNGAGVYGQFSPGNSSVSANWAAGGAGVWGDAGNTSSAYAGVLGTANNQSAGAFFNNGTGYFTLYASAGNASGYPFGAYNSANGNKGCGIDPNGNFSCTGSKNAVVPIDGGKRKVALAAIESPKNWFEDFGSERLSNGSAVVTLDADFGQTVNTGLEYHVFLTPNGDCKGLYVTAKTATSFEVRELGGGASSVAFDYRIVALRKDYENIRLADHTHDPDPSKMPSVSSGVEAQPTDMHRKIPSHVPAAASLRPSALN